MLDHAPLLVCCDGAAQALIDHGVTPHAIVGDGDSLPLSIRSQYSHLIHIVTEQEDNDLTKATRFVIAHAQQSGAHAPLKIAFLGCTGRREDHTLGNIALMARYHRNFHILPILYTDYGFFTPALGTHSFASFPRQQVSIFNISANTLTSEGLRWSAYPYTQLWQGTLNESIGHSFTIHADGEYLIFQTYEPKLEGDISGA